MVRSLNGRPRGLRPESHVFDQFKFSRFFLRSLVVLFQIMHSFLDFYQNYTAFWPLTSSFPVERDLNKAIIVYGIIYPIKYWISILPERVINSKNIQYSTFKSLKTCGRFWRRRGTEQRGRSRVWRRGHHFIALWLNLSADQL